MLNAKGKLFNFTLRKKKIITFKHFNNAISKF